MQGIKSWELINVGHKVAAYFVAVVSPAAFFFVKGVKTAAVCLCRLRAGAVLQREIVKTLFTQLVNALL